MTETCSIEITPVGPIHASIRPPGSKSLTNRALVCAALAEGRSILTGVLDCDDTRVMLDAICQLGLDARHDPAARTVHLPGAGGGPVAPDSTPERPIDLFIGNSGTTVRFLTAALALGQGVFRLDGVQRMRERPIEDLLDALRDLGANVRSEAETGCPPVIIRANRLPGGTGRIAGNLSSQFLSALLMAAPGAQNRVELVVEGDLVSKPYIEMTLAVMRAFGVEVEAGEKLERFSISAPQTYRAREYAIEPDASAASYFFAAAAITGGQVTVEGLSRESLQGDVAFCDCLAQMGCTVDYGPDRITVTGGGPLRGIDIDMNPISDTVQTLAAVAPFADGPTRITNVGHIRHKETDRISALVAELGKLGVKVEEREDGLTIHPAVSSESGLSGSGLHGAEIDTYDDHRMAMSLALVGLRQPGVVIRDPGCTAKTYPAFFDDLAALTSGR